MNKTLITIFTLLLTSYAAASLEVSYDCNLSEHADFKLAAKSFISIDNRYKSLQYDSERGRELLVATGKKEVLLGLKNTDISLSRIISKSNCSEIVSKAKFLLEKSKDLSKKISLLDSSLENNDKYCQNQISKYIENLEQAKVDSSNSKDVLAYKALYINFESKSRLKKRGCSLDNKLSNQNSELLSSVAKNIFAISK